MTTNFYQEFLALLEQSPFAAFLSDENIEELKKIYENAGDEKIRAAIEKIHEYERDLEQRQKENEKHAEEAADELRKTLQEIQKKRMLELKKREKMQEKADEDVLDQLVQALK